MGRAVFGFGDQNMYYPRCLGSPFWYSQWSTIHYLCKGVIFPLLFVDVGRKQEEMTSAAHWFPEAGPIETIAEHTTGELENK